MRVFILPYCPHCKRALNWMNELYQENNLYKTINIDIIDEEKESELANEYDYYYVPSFFDGNKKLHEGVASKEIIKKIFDDYLEENV